MPFLRNAWYMAGWAKDLKPGEIFSRTICDEPIAFFRDWNGGIAALEDRCCHRHYPLSLGAVVNNTIQCGYHGFQYDAKGACVKIPSQPQIPENARVKCYALVERHQCLWVWMGEAASADMSTVPDLTFLDDPVWGWRGTLYPVKSRYQFIIENLMDLTHLAFVHTTTIGNSAVIEQADVKTTRGENDVQVHRWMINIDPPPTYAKVGDFKGQKVDRWQLLRYTKPSIIRLWTGAAPHGKNARENIAMHGAPDGGKLGGIGFVNLNLITPETQTSTHYFWAQGQDLKPGNQTMTDMVFEQANTAFKQDWALFEQQQIRTDQKPDAARISVRADAGGVQSINMLNRAIKAEQTGSPAS